MSKMKSSPPLKSTARSSKLKVVGVGCLIFVGVFVVGVIMIAAVGLGPGLSNFFGNGQTVTTPAGLDDKTSPEILAAWREKAEVQLNSYGWMDKGSDIVRIPIDQAMVLIAEHGLPLGSEGIEATTPEENLPASTPAPEGSGEVSAVETPLVEEAAPPLPTPEVGGEAPAGEGPIAEESVTATPGLDSAPEPATEEPPLSEPSPTAPPEPTVNLAEVSFKDHVQPIFEQHCLKCHGGESPEGEVRMEEGLNLTTYEDIMAGSINGSVIEPGNVADSYLIEQIVTGRMPKEGADLSPDQIQIITAWVEAGAPNN